MRYQLIHTNSNLREREVAEEFDDREEAMRQAQWSNEDPEKHPDTTWIVEEIKAARTAPAGSESEEV